jgi:FeS assembly SUF system protein
MSDEYKYPNSVASLTVVGKPAEPPPVPAIESKPDLLKPPVSTEPLTEIERKLLEGKIIAAISQVYDPEIPVNVYELGLIYGIDIAEDRSVTIRMTLTAPGCPVAGSLPAEVGRKAETVPDVKDAEVVLVWDPPWTKAMMSEAALLQLGM